VETDDIMTARVGLTDGTDMEREEQVRFWETLLTRVQSEPGIRSAAVTNSLPGHGTGDGPVSIQGRDYGDVSTKPFVNHLSVSPTYFETFRIVPTQGRLFDGRDTMDSLSVVVINEFMARSMFPDESPIGKRILFDLDEEKIWYTIIGVVPNVVMDDDGTVDEGVYMSVLQHPQRFMSIAVRGEGDPRGLVGAVRTALAQTDPDLALYWLRTFDESRMVRTAGFRIIGTMFAAFAGVALVLAAAGLFGVLAFHVGQRQFHPCINPLDFPDSLQHIFEPIADAAALAIEERRTEEGEEHQHLRPRAGRVLARLPGRALGRRGAPRRRQRRKARPRQVKNRVLLSFS